MRAAFVVAACCTACACAVGEITFEAVALRGDQAPELPPGYHFGGFQYANIDDDGTISIVAALRDSQQNDVGIGLWAGPRHDLRLIARTGDPAPGPGSPQVLGEHQWVAWVSGGYIVFGNRMVSGRRGYFGGPLEGPIERIAAELDPVIGGGAIIDLPWHPHMQHGRVVFEGRTAHGSPGAGGYWGGPIGNVQQLARTGQPAPGLGAITFGGIGTTGTWRPAIADDGTMYITPRLNAPEGTRSSIWASDGQNTELVIMSGEQAPSFPAGRLLSGVLQPIPGRSGEILFYGAVETQVFATLALWVGAPGNWTRLAATGDPVPAAPGYTISSMVETRQNRSGQVVSLARVTSQPGALSVPAVLTGTRGNLHTSWGAGAPVPGSQYGFSKVDPPTINDAGQIAFTALAAGHSPPPWGPGPYILWATRRGRLLPVVITGRPIDLGGGTVRTVHPEHILHIASGSPNDGKPRSLNNSGELIVTLRFTDGPAGVFIASLGDESCYANCNGRTTEPILSIDDFLCFMDEFAAALALPEPQQLASYANCTGTSTPPVLSIDDFVCFMAEFALGCP